MTCSDIINLIALIVIPILAVVIAHVMQIRSDKRKDKMQIFKILMTARIYGSTTDSVHALNLIDVVFAKDKSVRVAWKNLFDAYNSAEQSELIKKKRQDLMYKLLEAMAASLGYQKEITWETIQNPYVPEWLVNQWQEQTKSQQTYNSVLAAVANAIPKSGQSMEESK